MYRYLIFDLDALCGSRSDTADGIPIGTHMLKNIKGSLKRYSECGYKLAAVIGKSEEQMGAWLTRSGISKYFEVMTCRDSASKEDGRRQLLEETLDKLHIDNEDNAQGMKDKSRTLSETVLISNNPADIKLTKNLNIDFMGLEADEAGRSILTDAGAQYAFKDITDLEDRILETVRFGHSRQFRNHKPVGAVFSTAYILAPYALYLILSQVTSMVTTALLRRIMEEEKALNFLQRNTTFVNTLSSCIIVSVPIIVIFLFYRRRDPVISEGRRGLPVIVFLGAGMALFFNQLIMLISRLCRSEIDKRSVAMGDMQSIIAGAILYIILSPLLEEMLFRWIIYGRLKRIFGEAAALIFSAILFGLHHGNLWQGLYAVIMGLIMGILYKWFDTLFAPLIFHAGANGMVYMAAYLPEKIKQGTALNAGSVILGVSSLVVFYGVYRKYLKGVIGK